MLNLTNMAIVGSGPTAIYLLKHISSHLDMLKSNIKSITIFEKEKISGMGMPYHPATTDKTNLSNISSEEIPGLPQTFGDWLRQQDNNTLAQMCINDLPIDDKKVYSRIALGHYFRNQYLQLLQYLNSQGINIMEYDDCEIIDIVTIEEDKVEVIDLRKKSHVFSAVVIANGHSWKEKDSPQTGYFASPWPIHKLQPQKDKVYNFPIGILGASLSAFDVVSYLCHRHGKFIKVGNTLKFIKNKNASQFKIVLHSTKGWLPHLQYEQEEPFREIYRHFNRKQLIGLIGRDGFVRIETFFNALCRAPLIAALTKDRQMDVVGLLHQETFTFRDFVGVMTEKHEYINSFIGMRYELKNAKDSVQNHIPIYWMETLDDLMYSLNYHAELLPAEDHLFFQKEIMPFLMNVIAALPLQSANILLALYDSGCIELKTGFVALKENTADTDGTCISLKLEDGREESLRYKLFVNCSGQKKLELEDYPFPSLVKNGTVRGAYAKFANASHAALLLSEHESERVVFEDSCARLQLSGIDIDSGYKTIDKNGNANSFLFDINFTHATGLRPYSYGLQACSASSLILVESWVAELVHGKHMGNEIEDITKIYENTTEL